MLVLCRRHPFGARLAQQKNNYAILSPLFISEPLNVNLLILGEKQNDGYLFASIPPELLEEDTPIFKRAKKKGLNIFSETIKELSEQPEIKGMDVFRTLFDKLTNNK